MPTKARDIIQLRIEAEKAVHGLGPMNAPARRMEGGWSRGVHGRRRAGPGDAFWQYRGYAQGDSPREVDWRRSARTDDQLFIRQKEWESARNVWFWCDTSGSMTYQSKGTKWSKKERAIVLALAAARLLSDGGERIGYLNTGQSCHLGRFGLDQLSANIAAQLAPDNSNSLPPAPPRGRHAHAIMLSDFLLPEAQIKATMTRFRDAGIHGQMIQVLDPAEFDFPLTGRVRVRGLEGEEEILLPRAEARRRDYQAALHGWQDTLRHLASEAGWSFSVHNTSHSPSTALIGLSGGHFSFEGQATAAPLTGHSS